MLETYFVTCRKSHVQKRHFSLGKTKPQNKASLPLTKLLIKSQFLKTKISGVQWRGQSNPLGQKPAHPHCIPGCISADKKDDATCICRTLHKFFNKLLEINSQELWTTPSDTRAFLSSNPARHSLQGGSLVRNEVGWSSHKVKSKGDI